MNRPRPAQLATVVTVAALAVLALLPAAAGASGPTLKLTLAVGPPTTATKADGAGYPAGDAITVTFDGATVASATTSPSGTFTAPFTVPASALPGAHTVAAFDPAGLGATATFLVQTDWGLSRFDAAGSGWDPYENVLSPSNADRLSELAAVSLGGPVHSEPIYTGGDVVVGSDAGTVQRLDAFGHRVWSFAAGGPVVGSPVAYPPSTCRMIVAGSQDGSVYGLNATRGTKMWSLAADGPISASPVAVPAVQKTKEVVAVSDKGSVYALNACDGSVIWIDPTLGPVAPQTPAVLTNVTISDGTTHTIIVVCFADGSVRVLDAATGAQLWSAKGSGPIQAPPAVYGSGRAGRVLMCDGSVLIERNAGTGVPIWSRPTGGAVTGVGLYSVARTSRSEALKTTLQSVIAGDAAGDVYSLNPANGQINWGDTNPGAAITGPPAIANGVVYLTTAAGKGAPAALIGLRASDGGGILHADELNPQPYPPGPPSIGDGMVFIGDFDASFATFGLPR